MTVSNSVFTASSTGSLDATGITVATLLATSQISAGSVYAPLATIAEFVATNVSSGSVSATNATVPQIVATNVSSGTVSFTSMTGSQIVATNVSSGTLNLTTGMTTGTALLLTTTDATGLGTGGSLTVLGGAAISNKLYVGTNLYSNSVDITPSLGDISAERSFSAANNQAVAANVTSFSFDNAIVRSFNSIVSIIVERSVGGNLYSNFEIKGIQKASSWVINTSYVGDYVGITFSVTSSGQIQYTSTNQANWTASTMKFRAHTTSV
jgi:hypothetical protein